MCESIWNPRESAEATYSTWLAKRVNLRKTLPLPGCSDDLTYGFFFPRKYQAPKLPIWCWSALSGAWFSDYSTPPRHHSTWPVLPCGQPEILCGLNYVLALRSPKLARGPIGEGAAFSERELLEAMLLFSCCHRPFSRSSVLRCFEHLAVLSLYLFSLKV